MKNDSSTPAPEGEKAPSFGIGSFLFGVVLAFVFFLLAQSMVRHRYCEGRKIDHLTTQTPIHVGP
jgi:hypothetical protein